MKKNILASTLKFVFAIAILLFFSGCSSSKFLSEGERVLSKVELKSEEEKFDASSFRAYVRQEANARWFNAFKVPLGLYCLSGRDSSDGVNRFFRRIGEAPVVYDSTLTESSRMSLTYAMINKGFLNARTSVESSYPDSTHVKVKYLMNPGRLYRIRTIDYKIDEEEIENLILKNESKSLLKVNMPCDADILDQERDRLVSLFHRNGYYNILKNYISYDVDSTRGFDHLDLLVRVEGRAVSKNEKDVYTRYRIRNVVVDINLENKKNDYCDSVNYRGLIFRYYGKRQFRPSMIYAQLRQFPGDYYNEESVQQMYHNFSNQQALRYAVIRMEEADSALLDCHITLQANKTNALSSELEGTNTSGDMGVAASLSFTNRNLFRGSEVWTTKIKGAFEAITGLEGYNDQDYYEFSAETHLSFPRILIPFYNDERRKKLNGNSELSLQFNSQERPEFHRRVLTGAWSYRWSNLRNRAQHKLDVLSVNYVFMPWISNTFKHDYLDSISSRSAIIRYSYENLFIVNSGYSFIYNSSGATSNGSLFQKNAYQLRFNVESAGNLLYLIAKSTGTNRNEDGNYCLFKVPFAQYVKFDFDYARSFLINARNSFAIHSAFGIALPYGNASIVPFEKRYFAGGPNSVRGWSVRGLGPGSYSGKDGKVDFINQTGNLKILFSAELRSYLFWKFYGALFVDAGNVWNTRDYAEQEGGQFRFDKFYKQVAVSYGLGLRLDLDYFILRLDWGMKAVDPTIPSGKEHYPILNPSFGRDLTFHFAVGLPF